MTRNLDLRELTIDRSLREKRPLRRRHLATRYLLPAVVLTAFLGMLGFAARDRWLPARPVTVVPVVVTRAQVQQAGATLFQAAGWVEPRPSPVLVSAMAPGVVKEVLVVEGQEVIPGQPLVRLIDVDAQLAARQAQAELQLREAELASAQAELTAAQAKHQQPVHLQAALAEAESLLAKAEGELAAQPFEIQAAKARELAARQQLESKQAAGSAVAGRQLQQAQGELDMAIAQHAQLRSRGELLKQEIAALQRKRTALAKQLELKVDESRALAEARAKVQAATARREQARLAVETAQLQLARMEVRSPSAGRVLELMARPGSQVAGSAANSAGEASVLLSLYDPGKLQVRVDVRLEDVPQVEPDQPVQIESPSAPGPVGGKVLFATSRASVQKNTLEVKASIDSPPPALRPEMLVQVTFLASPKSAQPPDPAREHERLLVPRQLVEGTAPETYVWLADPVGAARRQKVKLGRAHLGELVEVVEGLNATDKLMVGGREGVTPGERIEIVAEDASVGVYGTR